MSIVRWTPLALVLLTTPALAQDGEPAEEAEGSDGEADAPDAPPEGGEASDAGEGADAPAVEEAPEVVPEAAEAEAPADRAPEPTAAVEEEPPEAAEPEAAADLDPPSRDELAASMDRAPWFTIHLGGGGTQVLDSGWSMLRGSSAVGFFGSSSTDDELLRRFHLGVDVYPHPHIGVSVGFSRRADETNLVGTTAEGDLTFSTSVTSLDVAGKFVLAPPFLVLRPYARAGGGFFAVDVDLTASQGSGNLKTRQYSGTAPYAIVGGGLEIVSPRRHPEREDGRVRWGAGFYVEGGATLGGGGRDVEAAPTVDLGVLGDLSLGPAYVRMGLVILL